MEEDQFSTALGQSIEGCCDQPLPFFGDRPCKRARCLIGDLRIELAVLPMSAEPVDRAARRNDFDQAPEAGPQVGARPVGCLPELGHHFLLQVAALFRWYFVPAVAQDPAHSLADGRRGVRVTRPQAPSSEVGDLSLLG